MDVLARTAVDVCELWLSRSLTALEDAGAEEIAVSYVAAGAISWDSCCGVLVAAPERIYRAASFPSEGTDEYECETFQLVVDVVLLLLRCVPTIDNAGRAPSPAAISAAYDDVLSDAAVIWNTVNGPLPEGWLRANVDQAFIGAEGGCIGVETRLTIGLPQDAWCLGDMEDGDMEDDDL